MKPSKLALTDRLIVELTLIVGTEIGRRTSKIQADMPAWQKKGRSRCIHCFGDTLRGLHELSRLVEKLRAKRQTGMTEELVRGLRGHVFIGYWHWANEQIDVEQRIREILDS